MPAIFGLNFYLKKKKRILFKKVEIESLKITSFVRSLVFNSIPSKALSSNNNSFIFLHSISGFHFTLHCPNKNPNEKFNRQTLWEVKRNRHDSKCCRNNCKEIDK